MKCKIRYAGNSREYEEEITNIVIYDKAGKQAAYIYTTIWDDLGFCILDNRSKKGLMVGNPED
jgi:hypothetical protein